MTQNVQSSVRSHPSPVVVSAGALAAALGLAVLVGWHTENLRLIQVYPGMTPMAYNASVAFVALDISF